MSGKYKVKMRIYSNPIMYTQYVLLAILFPLNNMSWMPFLIIRLMISHSFLQLCI